MSILRHSSVSSPWRGWMPRLLSESWDLEMGGVPELLIDGPAWKCDGRFLREHIVVQI
jgi:hypothetical protein